MKYVLTYDGKRGETEYSSHIPEGLYKNKELIKTSSSVFGKFNKQANPIVFETVYKNY